ncbi:MAG: ubiquinone/menaquinone biosynthesis methyltransferase [bacterium]
MFHSISPVYDFLNHMLSMNMDRRWRAFAARVVCGVGKGRVLDACSGTGDLALAVARRAGRIGAKTFIVAADFTPSMMALARRKFESVNGGAMSVAPLPMIADTMRLPFADSCFDAVMVGFGIRNVADARAGLEEMARVCRRGGRVAVLEFSHPRNPVVARVYGFYFRRVLPVVGWLMTRRHAYGYLVRSVDAFPDGEDFSAMLAQATGGQVSRYPLTFGIVTLYVAGVETTIAGKRRVI